MRWIAAVAVCLVAAGARADDWTPHRDPFDPQVVRRYKDILVHDPHDDGALRQLVALYQRYRTVAALEAEYRSRLDAGDDWATLVVLARFAKGSRGEVLALWKRAVAANPDDALGWIATGDATVTDAAAARDAYLRAAKLVTAPRHKKLALTKLIGAARLVGDFEVVDNAYGELIALAPKDGMLWLDRGTAQLAGKRFDGALGSFTTAESLFGSDPERRLSAMMNRAIALEGLARPDDAIAQYERTLDKLPSGYYLGRELVQRMVEVDRKRGQLPAAIARLDKRWPERRRGYFEWATLGDLRAEVGDDEAAIDAYKRAVAKAPTEIATQRKLIALLDKAHPGDALAQVEAAARVAPGDADLQLDLAKRYFPNQSLKAFATLDALSKRFAKDAGVRTAIAAVYEQWDALASAIIEYEAIAALEPNEPDHAIVLGDAHWRAKDPDKARAAWRKLDDIGTATAVFRHGEVLALHEVWDEAVAAYTKALALDGTNMDAWYGRARANDALRHFAAAAEDARRAVALGGYASYADGLRNRQLLTRVLGHAQGADDRESLAKAVATWRFAFDHGDVGAGYLLAAHHARIRSPQQHEVLVQLYRMVPADDALGIAVARSYERRHEWTQARNELAQIGRRSPARAEEIATLIGQVDKDRERTEQELRWQEEGRSHGTGAPDLVGRDHRFGMRFALGSDVRGSSGALVGFGIYRTYRMARGTAFAWRIDWTQHDDPMGEIQAIGIGGEIATRLLDTRKLELALGVGPHFELRYGDQGVTSQWGRGSISGDVTLELLPRALPAVLGLRFSQDVTDTPRTSALLVELGFEIR